ncbi:MAG: hypothetical protein IPJ88_04565 [Myxococcales bacterium]|nr:MAG: hypothetical protein IPJ88_04565 [Myxococcales bacterium]
MNDYIVREIATPRCRYYKHAVSGMQPAEVEQLIKELSYREFMERLVEGLEFRKDFPGDHINWWDEDKIIDLLKQVGFSEVYPSRRGQSMFPPLTDLDLFDSTQPNNSLFVEAVR